MASLLFYLMAVGAVVFSIGVVALRTPIANVLSLLGSFFCLATIYLVVGFPLLAAVQILVYAGAILVLFLFVIMLLNLADSTDLPQIDRAMLSNRRLAPILAVAAGMLGAGLFALGTSEVYAADPALAGRQLDDARSLATAMFSTYLLPFEATSVLLLATAVAVMVLAKRERGAPGSGGVALAQSAAEPRRAPGGGEPLFQGEPPAPRPAAPEQRVPAREPAGGRR